MTFQTNRRYITVHDAMQELNLALGCTCGGDFVLVWSGRKLCNKCRVCECGEEDCDYDYTALERDDVFAFYPVHGPSLEAVLAEKRQMRERANRVVDAYVAELAQEQ